MIYNINNTITPPSSTQLYTSDEGQGYFKYHQLHLIDQTNHYIYKFEYDAWYMRNSATFEDKFIGEFASPTLSLTNIVVNDNDYWNKIQVEQTTETADVCIEK